jgi:hypothetical protein
MFALEKNSPLPFLNLTKSLFGIRRSSICGDNGLVGCVLLAHRFLDDFT